VKLAPRRGFALPFGAPAARSLSDKVPAATATAKKSGAGIAGGIAGLWQRVTSFLVGAGLTALASQFYLFREVRDGNQAMLKKHKELEIRLLQLEEKQK